MNRYFRLVSSVLGRTAFTVFTLAIVVPASSVSAEEPATVIRAQGVPNPSATDAAAMAQLAVMRYIWFVTGEEAQRIRTRVYVENGFGQFVSPDLLEKFGYDRLLKMLTQAEFSAAGASGAKGGKP